MGYKQQPKGHLEGHPTAKPRPADECLVKAFDDEMLFVLMARDYTAPAVIMEWIKLNLNKQPIEKLRAAFETAMEMLDTVEQVNNDLRRQKHREAGDIRTHRVKGPLDESIMAAFNVETPRDSKILRRINGQWKVVLDRSQPGSPDYFRVAFYDEEPSEQFLIRIHTDEMRPDAYIEYSIRVLIDGTLEPVPL